MLSLGDTSCNDGYKESLNIATEYNGMKFPICMSYMPNFAMDLAVTHCSYLQI